MGALESGRGRKKKEVQFCRDPGLAEKAAQTHEPNMPEVDHEALELPEVAVVVLEVRWLGEVPAKWLRLNSQRQSRWQNAN